MKCAWCWSFAVLELHTAFGEKLNTELPILRIELLSTFIPEWFNNQEVLAGCQQILADLQLNLMISGN